MHSVLLHFCLSAVEAEWSEYLILLFSIQTGTVSYLRSEPEQTSYHHNGKFPAASMDMLFLYHHGSSYNNKFFLYICDFCQMTALMNSEKKGIYHIEDRFFFICP